MRKRTKRSINRDFAYSIDVLFRFCFDFLDERSWHIFIGGRDGRWGESRERKPEALGDGRSSHGKSSEDRV